MSTRAPSDFTSYLAIIAGADQAVRLQAIDKYDAIRKSNGRDAAWAWLESEAAIHQDPLHHVLKVVVDPAARRIIESALQHNDREKIDWLKSRLTPDMIENAGKYCGLDNEKIKAQTTSSLEARRLRAKVKESVAMINLATGAIGGKTGYMLCTPYQQQGRNWEKEAQRKWAEETFLYEKRTAQVINMWDVISKAGKKRIAEILALAKGLQEFGEKNNLVPIFYTPTAPPRMHWNPVIGRNSSDGTSPREAQAWIHARHRAAFQILRDEGILPAGVRTTEGMMDATPHWHAMAWLPPQHIGRFEEVLRGVAPEWKRKAGLDIKDMSEDYYDKNGKLLDPAKALSYLFKYLIKSIGGFANEEETNALLGNEEADKEFDDEMAEVLLGKKEKRHAPIESHDTWRSTFRIRGFQFFGMPSLTLWRNLRKIEDEPKDELLSEAWSAAKNGEGMKFLEAAGGLNVRRKDRPIEARIEEIRDEEDDGKLIGKIVVFENRLNGFVGEQRLKIWEIIDKEQAEEKELNRSKNQEQLTVIDNFPREATPTPNPISEGTNSERNGVRFTTAPPDLEDLDFVFGIIQ